jgi:hypothetical protein
MSGRSFSFGRSGNPLVQVLSLLALAVVLVGALIMGAFVLMALLGLGVLAFVGYKLRAWWLRRGMGKGNGPDGRGPGSGPGPAKGIRYIEGEYEVIDADPEAERRRSSERR